ncbi:flavin reductase family protein [Clostridium transplantifaecale]|uniref:flavin reductase family protein n=1 Tax=Clostridium transplantifaecale TaxID=2479838 RepID=UPI000F630C00|nr:flavin reductase family protein [Clostridium transplantifaecale]
MKKNIGPVLSLYPTPLVVIGAMVNEKPNWVLVGHLGIMGHNRLMVSLAKAHYTNQGIKANGTLTVNIVDEALLPKADRSGCVSGAKADKSRLFEYEMGEAGAPVIKASPLTMECTVTDNYETEGFDNFILKIENTYAEPSVLNENGKVNYHVLKPVLFEMPTYEYLRTGEVIGNCMKIGKE